MCLVPEKLIITKKTMKIYKVYRANPHTGSLYTLFMDFSMNIDERYSFNRYLNKKKIMNSPFPKEISAQYFHGFSSMKEAERFTRSFMKNVYAYFWDYVIVVCDVPKNSIMFRGEFYHPSKFIYDSYNKSNAYNSVAVSAVIPKKIVKTYMGT